MSNKFCGKCGFQLYDGSVFCPNCGNQIAPSLTCQDCGRQLHPETEMCPGCGKIIENIEVNEIQPEKNTPELIDNSKNVQQTGSIVDAIISNTIDDQNNEIIEPEILSQKKHKLLKAQSTIQLSKIMILMIGIIILFQNILMLGMIAGVKAVTGNTQGNAPTGLEHRGNNDKNYKNIQSDSGRREERNFSNERQRPVTPQIPNMPGNVLRLFLLLAVIGLIQGGGFIFLSRWVDRKPFIAILIAFIFEITYDILKIIIAIYRAVKGINFGFSNQMTQMIQGSALNFLIILQAMQITVVSVILCYYLGKGLFSAIELRKMSE